MEDKLIQIIETMNYPIFRQGSLGADEEYPESFFTFYNNYSDGYEFYDNDEHSIIWDFDLNFYSMDPDLMSSKLLEAKTLLKSNGFIVTGKGHDVRSDEKTHTGRGIDVKIIEKI